MNAMMEAFYFCLFASIIWAPIVFIGSILLSRKTGAGVDPILWPSALTFAAAPALLAPLAAAMGWSLRTPQPLPIMTAPTLGAPAPSAIAPALVEASPTLDPAMIISAAAGLYFYGFLLFTALGAIRLAAFSYRVRYSVSVTDAKLLAELDHWRLRIGVRQPLRVAYSDAVASVCVHGFFRPRILMPFELLDRVSREDAILMGAHELAHIKRGDTWLFTFCTLAKSLFWFNPFMRRIVAHANLAAEQAADALVIASGVNRRSYARCFVESLKAFSLNAPGAREALVPSFTPFDRKSRRQRLDAILSGRPSNLQSGFAAKATLAVSAAAALALTFTQAAFAVAPPAKDALTHRPVDGKVTARFGDQIDPISKRPRHHDGIDYRAKTGTPVRAAGDGKVIDATARYNNSEAWGKVVVIDHGHGLVTRYAHLDSYAVEKGDRVRGGEVIAAVGSTGRSTGPHLHFEVIYDGVHLDPEQLDIIKTGAKGMTTKRAATLAPPAPLAPSALKAAIAPLPAPKAKAAPGPAPIPAPAALPAPPAPKPPETWAGKLENQLAGGFSRDQKFFSGDVLRLASAFEFDISDLDIDLSDADFPTFENQIEAEKYFEDLGIQLGDLKLFTDQKTAFLIDGFELSEEDRKEIEKARKRASREARRAQKQAMRAAERGRKEAVRAIERAQQEAVRAAAQAQREAVREMEAERREHIIEQQEHAREMREHALEHRMEMLEHRAEALREAEEELAQAQAELERERLELLSEEKD
ncbi:MAG: peptidoglycan DD-metalloendopeptidase family protein [Pseudomonadota bacterium]